MKHGLEMDLKDMDFKAINKEIEANEDGQGAQATQTAAGTNENPSVPDKGGNDALAI